jgi:hypothetical protein
MTYVNKNKNRNMAREMISQSKDSIMNQAARMDNEIIDILITAGILIPDLTGEYKINTQKYFGTFSVREVKK